MTTINLYNFIDNLINDKKKLLSIQKKNLSSFIFTHQYITNIIDIVREKILPIADNINHIIKKNLPIKILHITNFNYRFNGRLHYNTGGRINNGFIRLGHNVLTLSDRDIINANKNLTDPTGSKRLQMNVIQSYENFKPNLVVLGHADNVSKETLSLLKNRDKNLKIID